MISTVAEYCKKHLRIDKNDLDTELVQHASLFCHAAEKAAECISRVDFLKEKLALTDASVSTRLRTAAIEEGRKVTEAALFALILQSEEHQKSHKNLVHAREEAAKWGAAKESFSTRGYMLRDLCQLYIAAYYSKDSVTGPAVEEVQHTASREKLSKNRRAKLE